MEQALTCPYCWEPITMVLDPSVDTQTFVEDCEVCCHPIQVTYSVVDGEITGVDARKAQ